ncbi:hypothetical protein QBC38DRAFT_212131 [Podospora fimiseda]|uniref:Uncharacterized protein n=1 Tax=Podospora fimiseda TaxID=252190 RepID=A0AAN7GYA0_9PEZI|nr:hypothetical protein QBC38DRAFT_212131 [Podospora fimiseda]
MGDIKSDLRHYSLIPWGIQYTSVKRILKSHGVLTRSPSTTGNCHPMMEKQALMLEIGLIDVCFPIGLTPPSIIHHSDDCSWCCLWANQLLLSYSVMQDLGDMHGHARSHTPLPHTSTHILLLHFLATATIITPSSSNVICLIKQSRGDTVTAELVCPISLQHQASVDHRSMHKMEGSMNHIMSAVVVVVVHLPHLFSNIGRRGKPAQEFVHWLDI